MTPASNLIALETDPMMTPFKETLLPMVPCSILAEWTTHQGQWVPIAENEIARYTNRQNHNNNNDS
jgi:hypothetical protein